MTLHHELRACVRPTLVGLVTLTLLLGAIYPLVITWIASRAFPYQADGSLVTDGDRVIGSDLIGQAFSKPGYLWGRPSATSYNALASSGTNLGPTNRDLRTAVQGRLDVLQQSDVGHAGPVPIDLVTTSGSGLDPHISPAAARYQLARIARARGVALSAVAAVIESKIEGRQLGVLGEPRVNVLAVNRALDARFGRLP